MEIGIYQERETEVERRDRLRVRFKEAIWAVSEEDLSFKRVIGWVFSF